MNETSLFAEALEIKSDLERAAFLKSACGGDEKLQRRIEALLQANAQSDVILDATAELAKTANFLPITEKAGSQIGPYRLMEQIGEGGFGIVFVAEQQSPVRRKVALKLIKPGMDSRQVVARFEAERQALAMMDHPNIARVLDAGATETGRPYFVMELVRGISITEYCDKNHLNPRERMEIFVDVCNAIQHAHQKGIIHRDIKPSNVLVTSHDGKPVAKVIDFGVAKAIYQQLTERTIYTQFAQMIGTPLYMSPEQAEMSGLDIDTRTDIYALGVLLYELFTGSTPLEHSRLVSAAYDEVRRMIREDEPPLPSQRISTSATLPSLAANRNTEPARLSHEMKGELDWIVMKALEKDRTRRYDTASAFAADIGRYLRDEQVEACPPSTKYRLGKFMRRNRVAFLSGSLVSAALLVGIIASGSLAFVASQQAEQARVALQREAEQRQMADAARLAADRERTNAEQERDETQKERDKTVALNEQLKLQKEQERRVRYVAQMTLITQAWEDRNVRRVKELLNETRPGLGETDLRGLEWYYWQLMLPAEERRLKIPVVLNSERSHADVGPITSGSIADGMSFAARFSHDGKHVAVITREVNWKVGVWETSGGQLLFAKEFPLDAMLQNDDQGDAVPVYGCDICYVDSSRIALAISTSPSSASRLALSETPASIVWNLHACQYDTGEVSYTKTFQGSVFARHPFVFSRDGTRFAFSRAEPVVQVCDGNTGAEVAQVPLPPTTETKRLTETLALNSDGTLLAMKPAVSRMRSSDGTFRAAPAHGISIAEIATEKQIVTAGITAQRIEFSPDGKRLAAFEVGSVTVGSARVGSEMSLGNASKATVFDAVTGEEISSVTINDSFSPLGSSRQTNGPSWLGFSQDGEWLASLTDATSGSPSLKYWNTANGQAGIQLEWDTVGPIVPALDVQGNRFLALDKSGTLKVWQLRPEIEALAVPKTSPRPEEPDVDRLAHRTSEGSSPDGKWRWSGPSGTVRAAAPSSDTANASFVLTIKDAAHQLPAKSLVISGPMIRPPTFSSDGRFVATIARDPAAKVEDDVELKVWDLITDASRFSLMIPTIEGQLPADVRERLSSTAAPFPPSFQARPPSRGRIGGPTISPVFNVDGQLLLLPSVFGSAPKWVQAYDLTTGKLRWQVELQSQMNSPTLSADGKRLFCMSRPEPRGDRALEIGVWDAITGEPIAALNLPTGRSNNSFGPNCTPNYDGSHVALARDSSVLVCDVSTGRVLFWLTGNRSRVLNVEYSSDGNRILTGRRGSPGALRPAVLNWGTSSQRLIMPNFDNEIRIFDASTGQELLTVEEKSPLYEQVKVFGAGRLPTVMPEVEARWLVEWLASMDRNGSLLTRSQIVTRVRTDPTISEEVRVIAIDYASEVQRDMNLLNGVVWPMLASTNQQPEVYQRAEELINEAAENNSPDTELLKLRALLHYRLGQYSATLAELNESIKSRVADSANSTSSEQHVEELHFYAQPDELALRAMAFYQLGQADKARQSFYRARYYTQRAWGGLIPPICARALQALV